MARWYCGHKPNGSLEAFRSESVPTESSHGERFKAVIGPFRTRRAALWAERYGSNLNPHFRHVEDAERLSRNG